MDKYFARFSYGTPRLMLLKNVRETPKMIVVDDPMGGDVEAVLGDRFWYGTHLAKRGHALFDTELEAIEYLWQEAEAAKKVAREEVGRLGEECDRLSDIRFDLVYK